MISEGSRDTENCNNGLFKVY